MSRKVYIAGPMTGRPEYNVPAFNEAAARYRSLGYEVANPAELPLEHGYEKPWSFYMRLAIGMLLGCDAIVMLDGWQESRGATLEHHIATRLGLELLFDKERVTSTENL